MPFARQKSRSTALSAFWRISQGGRRPLPSVEPQEGRGVLSGRGEEKFIHGHVPRAPAGASSMIRCQVFMNGLSTDEVMERAMGLEPTTPGLGSRYSTIELCPLTAPFKQENFSTIAGDVNPEPELRRRIDRRAPRQL